MATIRLVSPEQATYVSTQEMLKAKAGSDTALAEVPDAQQQTQLIREYFAGAPGEIALIEVKCLPGMEARPHAHEHDEVLYILEGHLEVGNRHYGPESAIFIPANTLYHFTVGAEGVRYLNIKPCADTSYVTKEEYMRRRRESRTSVA